MLHNQYYLEFLLLAAHIQRSPWRWNLSLKDPSDEDKEDRAPDSVPKKERTDEEYDQILVEERKGKKNAGQRNSYDSV